MPKINVDQIISNSNSLEEVISALRDQSQPSQPSQVAAFNPLNWLKDILISDPTESTKPPSKLDYEQYRRQELLRGGEPKEFEEWVKMQEKILYK
jgi:hypothetical protein